MVCFYYNLCDCHAFIKGNLLTYLLINAGNLYAFDRRGRQTVRGMEVSMTGEGSELTEEELSVLSSKFDTRSIPITTACL